MLFWIDLRQDPVHNMSSGTVSGRGGRRRGGGGHSDTSAEAFRAQLDAICPRSKADFEGEEELSICSICLENIQTGERIRYLPCAHIYHSK